MPLRIAAALLAATLCASAAVADEVVLRNGDVLNGRITAASTERIVLEHPVLGSLDLPGAAVRGVRYDARIAVDGEPSGDGIAAAMAAVASAQASVPAPPPNPWKSRLELGFSGAEGNSDSISWHLAADTKREDDGGLWKFDARWDASESDGVETKNRASAGGRRDWDIGDGPLLAFAEARYDRDAFTEWDQRARLSAGVGFHALKSEDVGLKFRLGATGTKEWGSADDEHLRPEALVGVECSWRISASQSVEAHATWYPDLSDTPEFRLVSGAAWIIRLDEKGGVSLKLGIDHELDSHRRSPFDRQDLTYYGVLVIDF